MWPTKIALIESIDFNPSKLFIREILVGISFLIGYVENDKHNEQVKFESHMIILVL